MKTKLTVVLTITFYCILSPIFGQWERHNIDASVAYTCFVDADDMDGDGDMDVVVSEYGADMIRLYENDSLKWTMHDIGYLNDVVGLDIADFNNDGKLDVAAAAWSSDAVVWYKNNGGDPITWTRNTIDNTLDGAETVYAEDIDGDGAVDAVANGNNSGELVWYKNNLPGGWTKNIIGSKISGDANIRVGDINNDGKPDVVKAAANLSRVILYKNNLPDANWTEIVIDNSMYGTFMASIGDIDKDGDMDVAAAAQGATGSIADVAWYENDGNEQTWTKHTICTDLLKARCLYIVDIDNDGYMDIVVNDISANDVILFINEDGGQNWTKNIIDDNYNAVNVVFAYDIDLDGDFDIFPTSKADNALVWYENSLDAAYAHSLEVYPLFIQPLSDTLIVSASMNNPKGNPANVYAIIQGYQSTFTDTIQLYDDGLHGDGDSSDNMWSNKKLLSELTEQYDVYTVELVTHDLNLGTTKNCHRSVRFTTIGPVDYESHTFIGKDTEPNPGDRIRFELTLKNNSSICTAANIEAKLISLDTFVSTYDYNRAFGNIEAGENSTSDNTYIINISEECPVNTQIPIQIDISSDGYKFWTDTLYVHVCGPTRIEEFRDPITRIYPNPTNDILNIEIYSIGNQVLEIEIFSITGALIYQKEYRNINTHFVEQLNLSGYTKGVYLLKVRQDDEIYIKKVVVR